MHMKNYEVKELGDFLYKLKLKGKQSRMRTRFIKMLEDHLIQVENERQQLVEDYAKKDEDGKFITEDDNGDKRPVFENEDELKQEIAILMTEDFIIEESSDKEVMLNTIREIIYEYGESTEMSGDEAMLYDRFCEIVGVE